MFQGWVQRGGAVPLSSAPVGQRRIDVVEGHDLAFGETRREMWIGLNSLGCSSPAAAVSSASSAAR